MSAFRPTLTLRTVVVVVVLSFLGIGVYIIESRAAEASKERHFLLGLNIFGFVNDSRDMYRSEIRKAIQDAEPIERINEDRLSVDVYCEFGVIF